MRASLHFLAGPVGVFEVAALPRPTAAHSEMSRQVMASRRWRVAAISLHAFAPPVGLAEVTTLPA